MPCERKKCVLPERRPIKRAALLMSIGGFYGQQLARLFNFFPREQVKAVKFEEFREKAARNADFHLLVPWPQTAPFGAQQRQKRCAIRASNELGGANFPTQSVRRRHHQGRATAGLGLLGLETVALGSARALACWFRRPRRNRLLVTSTCGAGLLSTPCSGGRKSS